MLVYTCDDPLITMIYVADSLLSQLKNGWFVDTNVLFVGWVIVTTGASVSNVISVVIVSLYICVSSYIITVIV